MIRAAMLATQVRRWLAISIVIGGLLPALTAGSPTPSGDEILSRSLSILVGTPHISEEFVEVQGFWLPAHVRSAASSFLPNWRYFFRTTRPMGTRSLW